MNVWVAGVSKSAAVVDEAAGALQSVVERVVLLDASELVSWSAPSGRAAFACAADATGGVSYRYLEKRRFAAFAGRPIIWDEDGRADGRATLDARLYLEDDRAWAGALDGRCAVVRYDDATGELLVCTDSFGSYPVYSTMVDDTAWVSNNAAVLRELAGLRDLRADVLARFMGCGWSLGGTPLWAGVDRLPRAQVTTFTGANESRVRELLPLSELAGQFNSGFSAEAAAHALQTFARATSDWEGRDSVMTLTGGRDSRLVFSALVAAGAHVKAVTRAQPDQPGFPDTPDVIIARKLCEITGTPHETIRVAAPRVDLVPAMRVLRLVTPGTFSLSSIPGDMAAALSGQIPSEPRSLQLLFGGANGEISRAYYGLGDGMSPDALSSKLLGRLVPRYPPTLLNDDGLEVVRAYVREWVRRHLEQGLTARDLPDGFYLLERMQNWAGPMHGTFEYRDDVVSPLWSREVVRHQLGLDSASRARGQFHALVGHALAPQLSSTEYEGARYGSGQRARARKLLRQAVAEAERRVRPATSDSDQSPDALVNALPELREIVLSQSRNHTAWSVLNRRRTEKLLGRRPERLDPRSREQCWRLATVCTME